MLIAYPLGLATGALIPPEMVNHVDGQGIDGLLLLQFALAAFAAIICFGLQSAPPSAPSATAPYRRGNDNLGRDLKSLRRNFGFMTLCNIWGLSVGAIQVPSPPPQVTLSTASTYPSTDTVPTSNCLARAMLYPTAPPNRRQSRQSGPAQCPGPELVWWTCPAAGVATPPSPAASQV